MMKRRLPLTEVERLELLEAARVRRNNWVTYAPYLDMIRASLKDAELIPAREWDDMVALGSTIRVRRRAAAAEQWVLARPRDEDGRRGRLSVLTPLGWAVLGTRAGDVVYAATEYGPETYVVEGVSGDREAVGPGLLDGGFERAPVGR
jgi:regulator of nucleoside diphosphate kinase